MPKLYSTCSEKCQLWWRAWISRTPSVLTTQLFSSLTCVRLCFVAIMRSICSIIVLSAAVKWATSTPAGPPSLSIARVNASLTRSLSSSLLNFAEVFFSVLGNLVLWLITAQQISARCHQWLYECVFDDPLIAVLSPPSFYSPRALATTIFLE